MLNQVIVGPQANADSSTPITVRGGRTGELLASAMQADYYENVYRKNVFTAYAGPVTAPVIYSTAAGTGGPLLWNGSSTVNAVILAIGYSVSVVSTVAGTIGLTGGVGQAAAPGTTTAIDAGPRNTFIGGALPLCTTYRVGTPSNAGNFFIPLANMSTAALTTNPDQPTWIDLKGIVIVPPQAWVSIAGSATLSTLQISTAIVWAEIPV